MKKGQRMVTCMRHHGASFFLLVTWVAHIIPISSYSTCSFLPKSRMNGGATSLKASADDDDNRRVVVALTREDGKNHKLLKALQSHPRIGCSDSSSTDVTLEEIPCIEHADGPDLDRLVPMLQRQQPRFDYVAITSPEAANVFATAWMEADKPSLGMITAVGKATGETLHKFGIDVAFVPSKATAKTLVVELPESDDATSEGRPTTVLYPASARAKTTLQEGLEGRGFDVTRLDTYDTIPASWSQDQLDVAKLARVACFASPSAIRAWVENNNQAAGGKEYDRRVMAACIGETSAEACRQLGWDESQIFYPDKPGVEGWADAVADALENILVHH